MGGIDRDSVAMGHELATVDRSCLGPRVGTLPQPVMDGVDNALRYVLNP